MVAIMVSEVIERLVLREAQKSLYIEAEDDVEES
jgi:hypothetical protein